MATLQDHTIVMHPGPMVRGMEITADVADSARSVIVEQVTNGVAVRMAVLYLLLGGSEPAVGRRRSGRVTSYLIKGAAILGGAPTTSCSRTAGSSPTATGTSRATSRSSTRPG